MNDDLIKKFNFPLAGEAEAFWESQKLLGKIDSRFNLYFRSIIYNVSFADTEPLAEKSGFINNSFLNKKITGLYQKLLTLIQKNTKIECDILINPSFCTFNRITEKKLVLNLIESCTSLGLIVCVVCNNEIKQILSGELDDLVTSKNVMLINPISEMTWFQKKIVRVLSKIIAKADFREVTRILAKNRININRQVYSSIESAIYNKFSWLHIQKNLNFKFVILRCEWDDFSVSITESSKLKEIPVICFQHGVISNTLDVPVRVDRFLTFGEQSAKLMTELNHQFAQATNQSNLCSEFYPVGSITDSIKLQINNFSRRSVLIIDQSVDRACKFNGLSQLIEETERLIKALLLCDPVEKIVIRPHPQSKFFEFWEWCSINYPHKFDISHPRLKLEVDIQRNSIAVGLFSGALAVAAASGLPSYFLTLQDAYFTPDLNCFKNDFALPFDRLIHKLQKLTTDEAFYLEERRRCLETSSIYYAKNQQVSIDKNFIKEYILNM
jgi:hypothetical protein